MPFQAILFDVGDTLWHAPSPPPATRFRDLARQRIAPVLSDIGIVGDDKISRIARLAWDAIDNAIRTARHGDLREPDYPALVQQALAAAGFDLERAVVEAVMDAVYVSGEESGKFPFPESRDVLLELKARGFRLATATNRAFGGNRFRCDLAACGLAVGWDAHSISVEVGHLKPHPAVFEHALRELRLQPRQALMVGNSLAEDIAGAQRLGIRAAWRRSKPDAEDVIPDYTFDSLAELLDLPELETPGD